MKTMAERFVEMYREWTDRDPVEGEGELVDLSTFLHRQNYIGGDEGQVSFLQGWNVRHLGERTNEPFANDLRQYAILDFHDGSYAMSPVDTSVYPRRWLAGRPS